MDSSVDLDRKALVGNVELGFPGRERHDISLLNEVFHLCDTVLGDEKPGVRVDTPLGSANGAEVIGVFDFWIFRRTGRDVADVFSIGHSPHRFGQILEYAALFVL